MIRRPTGVQAALLAATWAACLILALLVTAHFLTRSGVNVDARARLASLMDGSAHRPFVHRTLLPSAVKGLTAATPPAAAERLEAFVRRSPLASRLLANFLGGGAPALPAAWAVLLVFASLVGYAALLLALARQWFPGSPGLALLAPPLGLAILPAFAAQGYLYDFPQLFLATLCLLAMGRERWGLYLVAFAIACVNKETTVLLLVPYAVHFRKRMPRADFVRFGAAQLGIFAAVKLGLIARFAENPGGEMEIHLHHHLQHPGALLASPALWTLAAALALAAHGIGRKPAFLRNALWMLPPFALLYLVGGTPGELRVLYEVHAPIVLLASASLVAISRSARAAGAGAASAGLPG
jgi:hypothetical protein